MIDTMDANGWNKIVASFPDPHILQTWHWGQVKSRFGWSPSYKIWGNVHSPDAAALILERSLSLGSFAACLRVLYVPKGPLVRDWENLHLVERVLKDLREYAHQRGAIFIKIDPDVPISKGIPGNEDEDLDPLGQNVIQRLSAMGWYFSEDQIQFRNTVLIDLIPSEDELLAAMKQKTRYNIRLAERKGVTVRPAKVTELDDLYRMYVETSLRDGFAIRQVEYYHYLWSTFMNPASVGLESPSLPDCEPLIAELGPEMLAAVVIFRFAGKAYYMQGMSRPFQRNTMPNYLLQWEAIRRAKATGCRVYDLWGAPNIFQESDPLWGVFRFKLGLGGWVSRSLGAYDFAIKPFYYRMYTQVLPRVLGVMRRHRKSITERMLGS
jgi:peptidoglycan pentaglycine glycine transferase (the first glycine)